MGLLVPDSFVVNISAEDRPRVDRLVNVLDRLVGLLEHVVNQKELVIRANFDNQQKPVM
jgi:hypothetical protein